jgi:DNA-binding CsgD family transcriptional regulator
MRTCAASATAAADAARAAQSAELMAEAALVLEATTDIGANTIAKQLCDEALSVLGDQDHEALEARLLAQRSHLAFYDGEQDRVESLSTAAAGLARSAGDDGALVEALHARKEACPGPAGRPERDRIATEMLDISRRTANARTAMWGTVWRIDTLVERGHIAEAADEVHALRVAAERVGGPVSAWILGRVEAFIAQAQGRYADASRAARQAFERMRPIERTPARGAHFALHCALAQHVRLPDDVTTFLLQPFEGPPRFRTMGRISRAFLSLRSGLPDGAAASYRELGPIDGWSLPVFFLHVAYVYATLVTIELGLTDDLNDLVRRLEAVRGEHIVGESIAYLGPVELALGRGALALGRVDDAIDDLSTAVSRATHAGAPGFVAEANYHLAVALRVRGEANDRDRARRVAQDADRAIRDLGMTVYTDRVATLLAELAGPEHTSNILSARERQVATLVAEGLTNRQIAGRLFISERTAQNHVQHILTKLGFTRRTQIATWRTHVGNE